MIAASPNSFPYEREAAIDWLLQTSQEAVAEVRRIV